MSTDTRPRKARSAFVLFVLVALLLLGLTSQRALSRSGLERERQFKAFAETRLQQVAEDMRAETLRVERELLAAFAEKKPPRILTREQALVRQAFVVDASGVLTFPRDDSDASTSEREFLKHTQAIFEGRSVLFEAPAKEELSASGRRSDNMASLVGTSGWIRRFWDDGQQWLFWERAGGAIVGAHVERIAFLARLCAAVTASNDPGRVILRDARNATVQQWGGRGDDKVVSEIALPVPLDGFRLSYVASTEQTTSLLAASSTAEAASVIALVLGFLAAALVVWREQTRAFKEAQTRVSFVTQVSHELKTPLTNIRLYAELLEREVDEEDERAKKHLEVITSESQRLSRLIDNVLSLSKARDLQLRPLQMDEVVERTLAQHKLALEQRGFKIETSFAGSEVRADPDALAQIVANLLSNVEKYAHKGGWLRVETRGNTINIRDKGPGIAPKDRERIFAPYVRLDDSLSEGASGTGIGLGIARDLARRMGGDLVCVDTHDGASFLITVGS
jgi:signal transduction histidine kinase